MTLFTVSTFLVSCSVEGMLPPADVDNATRVGSIHTDRNVQQVIPHMPVAVEAGVYHEPQILSAPQTQPVPTLDAQHNALVSSQQLPSSTYNAEGSNGVNMDEMLGVAPVVGLAEEQNGQISASIQGDWNSASAAQMVREQPVRAQPPQQQVAMLKPNNPTYDYAPSSNPSVMPQSEVSCRAELRRLGVAFKDVSRIAQGNSCEVAYPLELSGLASGVSIKPSVKLNCQVTLAFAKWVKFELVPSARFRYMSGVGRITPMGGYSCRKMNSRSSNPWSEHAKGNAIDIGTITLKNGKVIDVRNKNFFAFREKGLLKAVRNDSCKYFSTVLGPGSDPQHWNHFHFDLRTRKSGYRHCD